MGVAVGSSCVVSANPSSSHSSPAVAWGPSHGRQSFMNFSNTGPSHGLQFFTNCSSMDSFHGVQSFRNRLLQCGSSTCDPHGVTSHARSLLQHGLSTGSQPFSGACSCSGVGVLHGLQVDICSIIKLHGLQGDDLTHHGLQHELQRNLFAGARSTSSPSFFTDFSVCNTLSLIYSHSSVPTALSQQFFLHLIITKTLPPVLVGSALASSGSLLKLAGIGSIRHEESF